MAETVSFSAAWRALAERLDLAPHRAATLGDELLARHSEPQRHYHTERHIEAVIGHLHALDALSSTTLLAAFFHDAIYDPTAADNEEQSAALLEASIEHAAVAEAATIIRATAGHQLPDAATNDCRAFLDADLSILGSAPHVYAGYAEAIRAEYAHVPDQDYRVGRAAVLRGFVGRTQLYFTQVGVTRWDTLARSNLTAEIVQLESQN